MNKYVLLIGFLLFGNASGLIAQELPNIVWFVSEDNSPSLSSYQDTFSVTPHLDQFAKEGMVFSNAFSNAPVCAPSRSTLITGVLSPTLGSQHMRSSVEVDTTIKFFPQYLKEAGYFTSLRLKRDYNIPDQEGTWDVDDWWQMKDALKGRKKGQPYFLFYNTWMTHEGKLHDNKGYIDYFNSTFEHLEKKIVDSLRQQIKPLDPATVALPEYLPDVPETRDDMVRYYQLMQMMDLEFGHMLKYLEATGELENTIIIYSSDHGGILGRSKRFLFESGLHIPLIIRFPKGFDRGIRMKENIPIEAPVSLVDLAPTILSMAKIRPPAHMHGRNILSTDTKVEKNAFGFRGRMDETYDMVRTLRNKKYRYVRNYFPFRPNGQHIQYLWKAGNVQAWDKANMKNALNDIESAFFRPKPTEQLYDVTVDPDNVNNLANNRKYTGVLHAFRNEMGTFLKSIKDTGFIPEGLLYEKSKKLGTTYQSYTESQPIEAIIDAAHRATQHPNKTIVLDLMQDKNPAIRFWGAVGAIHLIQDQDTKKWEVDSLLTKGLRSLLEDVSGDTRVMAAEALFLLGFQTEALKVLAQLLEATNPYVVLRACNTLANIDFQDGQIQTKLQFLATSEEEYVARKASYLINQEAN